MSRRIMRATVPVRTRRTLSRARQCAWAHGYCVGARSGRSRGGLEDRQSGTECRRTNGARDRSIGEIRGATPKAISEVGGDGVCTPTGRSEDDDSSPVLQHAVKEGFPLATSGQHGSLPSSSREHGCTDPEAHAGKQHQEQPSSPQPVVDRTSGSLWSAPLRKANSPLARGPSARFIALRQGPVSHPPSPWWP